MPNHEQTNALLGAQRKTKQNKTPHRIDGRKEIVDVLDVNLQEGHLHAKAVLVALRHALEHVPANTRQHSTDTAHGKTRVMLSLPHPPLSDNIHNREAVGWVPLPCTLLAHTAKPTRLCTPEATENKNKKHPRKKYIYILIQSYGISYRTRVACVRSQPTKYWNKQKTMRIQNETGNSPAALPCGKYRSACERSESPNIPTLVLYHQPPPSPLSSLSQASTSINVWAPNKVCHRYLQCVATIVLVPPYICIGIKTGSPSEGFVYVRDHDL